MASSLPKSRRQESPPSSEPCLRFPATGVPKLHARIKLLRSLFIPDLANNLKELVLGAIDVGKLRGGALRLLTLGTYWIGWDATTVWHTFEGARGTHLGYNLNL